MKEIIGILSFLFFFHFCGGQSGSNPFEITGRAIERNAPTVSSESETVVPDRSDSLVELRPERSENRSMIEADTNNPFEIIEEDASTETPIDIKQQEEIIIPSTKPKQRKSTSSANPLVSRINPVGKSSNNRGQLFGVVLLALLPIAILFTIFRSFFTKAYVNVVNTSLLAQSQREFVGTVVIPMNMWYVAYWINAGIFLSLLMRFYEVSLTANHLLNALICIGIVSGLILMKHMLLSFMAAIFPVTKEIRLYSYLLLVFGITLGVFLMPINIAIVYAPDNTTKILIYIALAIVALLYIFRSFRALIVSNRLLVLHKFHFLLYICAVEIAPILLLIKLGIFYLEMNP